MYRRTPEILRRWLGPVALAAVTPKCFMCLLAYAGVGAALGGGRPEICGATDNPTALPALLGALAVIGLILHRIAHPPARTRPEIRRS
jgi:hypothetical protein